MGKCKNVLAWKAYCLASDLAWSSLKINALTNKVAKRVLRFGVKLFRPFANKCVLYLFGSFQNTTGSFPFQCLADGVSS